MNWKLNCFTFVFILGYGELNKTTDMATIVRAMARPDSGLEVRDRTWLIQAHALGIGPGEHSEDDCLTTGEGQ